MAALLTAAWTQPAAADRVAHTSLDRMAFVLRDNAVTRWRLRTDAGSAVVVRARGDWCAGAPRMALSVDGKRPRRVTLTRGWREYSFAARLAAGMHLLRVAFDNDRTLRGRCSRAVRLRGARVAPGVAATDVGASGSLITRPVPLGTALSWSHVRSDPGYAASAVREFASFTPENEMKMERLQPRPGKFDFAAADAIVDFAAAHGKQVHGHALVFGQQTPAWVSWAFSADDVARILQHHIATVMARYRGRVVEWDVVNEALDQDGHYRRNVFLDRLGARYVEMAFAYARNANPDARLYYNEFGAEVANRKRAATYELVRRLKERGLIDGVGLQTHTTIGDAPPRAQLEETMRMYESLGLDVQITEMDVTAKGTGSPATLPERLAAQAEVYRVAAQACANVPACKRFTVWGVSDRYSWLGQSEIPLLLDGANAAKPALAAMRSVFGRPGATT